MLAIVDYGMGNIHSVKKALQKLGGKVKVVTDPKELLGAEKIVLPGVGAFDDAVSVLRRRGLIAAIKKEIAKGKPFLGICLGMQLLFETSDESPKAKGMALLKGRVRSFPRKKSLPVPQIGWNTIDKVARLPGCQVASILKGIPDNSYVYFCHSYYPDPKDKSVIAASTNYGINFASVVCKDNIFGMQFHPEKSQAVGLRILKNFIELC